MWYHTTSRRTTPEQDLDRQILAFTRNAPAWVLRRVNAERRSCGMPEFRSAQFAKLHKVDRVLERGLGTVCGLATYGVSVPVSCDWDTRRLTESFSPTAFVGSVAEAKRGLRNVWLSLGHTSEALAETGNGTLSLHVHPRYGLQFWAKLKNTPAHRQVVELVRSKRLGVSVSFSPEDQETRPTRDGKRHRVVTAARLVHIALLDTTKTPPAYRSAVPVHTWGTDAESVSRALYRARLSGFRSAVELKLDRQGRG